MQGEPCRKCGAMLISQRKQYPFCGCDYGMGASFSDIKAPGVNRKSAGRAAPLGERGSRKRERERETVRREGNASAASFPLSPWVVTPVSWGEVKLIFIMRYIGNGFCAGICASQFPTSNITFQIIRISAHFTGVQFSPLPAYI